MIAYNAIALRHRAVMQKVRKWYAQQLLTPAQFEACSAQYTSDFYQPNFFIAIGLFLFTLLIVLAALGFYVLLFGQALDHSSVIAFSALLFAFAAIAALEILIQQKKLYRAGIDQALLYVGVLSMGVFWGSILHEPFEQRQGLLQWSFMMLPILLAAFVRYADALMAVLALAALYCVALLLVLQIGHIGLTILPFAMMLLSFLLYRQIRLMRAKPFWALWEHCYEALEAASLSMAYLSGNYFVLRNTELFGLPVSLVGAKQVLWAWFFYGYTALVPLWYVYRALLRKDRILLWVGMLMTAVALLTFKKYFSLASPEIAFCIAGLLLIAGAYAAIRYLKVPRKGLSFVAEVDEDDWIKKQAEAFVLAQTIQTQQENVVVPESNHLFQGGESSGAGAGTDF